MQSSALQKSKWKVLKVVELYYVDGKSATEISELTGLSPATISRMLNFAKTENIIRTQINDAYLHSLYVAHSIEEKFHIKECILSSSAFYQEHPDQETLREDVAIEGARFIQSIIQPDDVIGFGSGHTTYQIVMHLNPCVHNENQFVTLNGQVSQCFPQFKDGFPLSRIKMSIKGTLHNMNSTVYHENKQSINNALQEESVKDCFDLFPKITIAVCGTSYILQEEAAELNNQIFFPRPDDLQHLLTHGAYTNFLYRFFDRNGNEVSTDLKDRTLSIPMDQYINIPTRILVATGTDKCNAILSLLKGHYINTLIIDEYLGEELLSAT